MAYVTQTQVETVISVPDHLAFLDDERTGSFNPTRFAALAAMASTMVDAYLSGIYDTPFAAPGPAPCQAAALAFYCEMLYQRRLTPDQVNPFKSQANQWRKILDNIRVEGTGLDHAVDRDFDPGFAVTTPVTFNSPSL
jgi:phage gp36-like protein